ncbi:MAG: PQQ-dependent sugar dehydrogenase [Opitutales bacterium]
MGVGGLEFAPDGSLMVCTREGEVWKYRIEKEEWSLFADGLHESLGLWIDPKTGETFVIQRPEITKLVDVDGNGRADLYETFNADWGVTDNYHEYAFGLVRDSKGNFYGTLNTSLSWPGWARSDKWDIARVHDGKMGRAAKYRGWCFKVTPNGKFEPHAAGLRSPAGIGISKDDELFFTDNQGDWEASSSLHHIKKGRFHGHPSSLMDHPDYKGKDLNSISIEDYEKVWSRPAVWIPHGELAISPGEPIFDYTGGRFGPFKGQIFIGDQGRSNLMRVVLEKVNGEYQGVIFDFVNRLQTGCIRHVFAEDGSLWVGQTGRGWGSAGGKEFGLQRVVWDGKTKPFAMYDVKLTQTGFRITFTKPIDIGRANQTKTYVVERWGYHYHPKYGSGKTDHKKEAPTNVTVAKDGMSVHLEIPLETKRVYKLILNGIKAKDGTSMANHIAWYTLNRLLE